MKNPLNIHEDLIYLTDSIKHKIRRIEREEVFMIKNKEKFNPLTKRETQILYLLAKDLNNPQIADLLFISRFMVEQHRKNINRKLDIHSYYQLYQYALAFNLI